MRHMRRTNEHDADGFTLVEVLLTVLIMGWILVSISQILTVSRKTRDEIHNTKERMLAGPAILQRIEADVRALVTYNRDLRSILRIKDRSLVGYDADRIDFVSSTNGLLPFRESSNERFRRADVCEVGFCLRRRPDADDFLELYRREAFGVDGEPFEGGEYALMHDRVKGFEIKIFSEDGPDAEPLDEWGTEDSEEQGLPTRIEIEVTLEMAPRLVREQIVIDRRIITYKSIIRFPEAQRLALTNPPMPVIPSIAPTAGDPSAATGGRGGNDPTDNFGSGRGQGGGFGEGGGQGGGRGSGGSGLVDPFGGASGSGAATSGAGNIFGGG